MLSAAKSHLAGKYWAGAILLMLASCTHAKTETVKHDEEVVKHDEYDGSAKMTADRSIQLSLHSKQCDGSIAEGFFVYNPTDKNYQDILAHIGGLEPGQEKLVPAWPSPPCSERKGRR